MCVCVCVCMCTRRGPVPVTSRSKARVCGRLPAGIVDSNLAEGMVSVVSVVFCRVVSATS